MKCTSNANNSTYFPYEFLIKILQIFGMVDGYENNFLNLTFLLLKKIFEMLPTQKLPPRELPGTDVKSPYVIVSDGVFPLTEHLQQLYCRRSMEEREMVYNYRLSRARRVTENAFGVMSNRFRCLLGKMQLDPDVATDVVLACCVLHNSLRLRCGKG